MINLKIDPEFQSQIPPLTDDEFKQLEENILKEGKLISPLIVWNNTLVGGHNRYAILQKHPEIYFSTMPLRFENREEAVAWICRNQLGRRNLSPEQKRYLLGRQYEAEKKAAKIFRGNQYTLAKKSGGDHGDNHHSGKKTCDRIAEENGVSRASVLRARHYTRGIDIADNLSPGIKQKVFSGEVKFTNEEMSKLVQASVEHRSDVLAQILHPEALEVLESASAEFEPEKSGTRSHAHTTNRRISVLSCTGRVYEGLQIFEPCDRNDEKLMETSVYKGYKQDKIEIRGDRAEMSDFPLYLNTVAGGLDCRDQTIGGFSFVVKIYAVPVIEIIG